MSSPSWCGTHPGAGGSSDPPESFGMAGYADCLAGFIERLRLDRPHVAGLSFGGALALELYRRHSAIPMTLILASAYAGWAGSSPADVAEQRLRRALVLADLPPDEFVQHGGQDLPPQPPNLIATTQWSDSCAHRFVGRGCPSGGRGRGGAWVEVWGAVGPVGCGDRSGAMSSLPGVGGPGLEVATVQHRHGHADERRALGHALHAHASNGSGPSVGLEGAAAGARALVRWFKPAISQRSGL